MLSNISRIHIPSRAHRTLTNINYILDHKVSANKFKRILNSFKMLSDNNEISCQKQDNIPEIPYIEAKQNTLNLWVRKK